MVVGHRLFPAMETHPLVVEVVEHRKLVETEQVVAAVKVVMEPHRASLDQQSLALAVEVVVTHLT
jgi:hypothetical protein